MKTPVLESFFLFWVLRNFSEHLYYRLLLNKLFIKIIHKENFTLKNRDFFSSNIRNKWKCLLLFHDWFPIKFEFIHILYFFVMVRNRSIHRRCSVGIDVLSNFAKFLEKQLCQSCRPKVRRGSDTGVFLWILRNFHEHIFYRTPLDHGFLAMFPVRGFLEQAKAKRMDLV